MTSKSPAPSPAPADFGHLAKYDLSDLPERTFVFYDIEGEPSLTVIPATSANRPFWNAVMAIATKRKRSAQQMRRLAAGKVDDKFIEEQRQNTKMLIPRHCVVSWKGVKDSKGAEVPFSKENAALFLNAMPDWIYNDFNGFISNSRSFLGEDEMDSDEVEEMAGN